MKFRRVFTPAVLILTLLVQFLPGTVFSPQPVAAVACDAAQFVADVTIPDGSHFAPGSALVKTWRLKNVGTCTWSTSYAIVFYAGDKMGAPSAVNLPTSVAPNATIDVTVNMTAPSLPGSYRGYWMLRNASSVRFGVGPYATWTFFIDIVVSGGSSSSAYDFVANYASATWTSDSGASVQYLAAPILEDGSTGPAGLLTIPQNVTGGYIQGVYQAFTVQNGDHFLSIINCQYGATGCYVNFRLNYQIGSNVYTLKSFNEKLDGMYYSLDIDLSSLAGQSVNFILKVVAVGPPTSDRAVWAGARIARVGSVPPPPPPPTTCDKAAFVADVTIPDGTTLAAGTPFTKTWRLQNAGTCTWTTSYKLVFVGWDLMGASATSFNLPASVAPGSTTDLSVNLIAPSAAGNYYGYWILQNASGTNFGVGSSGTSTFYVNVKVTGSSATGTSTTTITADAPDPSTPGQTVAVSVTVSGAGATPTGTVAITGANTNCNITLASGSGTCNVIFSSVGAKTITATYNGDSNYASSSDTESHTVASTAALSTTAITGDVPDSSTPGQSVVVGVTVSGTGATPTGTVAITGADTNCTITLAGGSGSCNVVFTTTGNKTLSAVYSGDSNYATSSDTEPHTVIRGPSLTTITADAPDPSTPGQSVAVSVTVVGAGVTPTGTVAITGADTNCTITLAGGSGSCNVVFNTVGAKTLIATYSGDMNYTSSVTAPGEPHTVVQGPSTTKVTGDLPDPSAVGGTVTISVTVSGAGATPTGTVTISGDAACVIPLVGGFGSCTVTFGATGTFTFTATYSGDVNYLPSLITEVHTVN